MSDDDCWCSLGWTVIVFLIVLALAFVLGGEPDLWDKWHAQAMDGYTEQPEEVE
jgi:hypothetical protein